LVPIAKISLPCKEVAAINREIAVKVALGRSAYPEIRLPSGEVIVVSAKF
jgi:hypothetical protein